MIQIGNDKIKDIYVGSDKIKEVYYGSEKVWGEIESIQEGYWVHKDTGVKTYFDLDADFIMEGIMYPPSWVSDCSEVNIPEGVTRLGEYCFAGSTSLTSINMPVGVYMLYEGCFYGCSSLTSITLPESVQSLGMYCFMDCNALILATVLPAIPPSTGWGVFENVHKSFNIKVRSAYVNDYKTATNWTEYESIISAI